MTFAYIGVSTEKQHLENQMNEVKNFAHSRGITIDKWATDRHATEEIDIIAEYQ